MNWESVTNCLVSLPSEKGTAFIVFPEGYAFTCCHVIKKKEINTEIDCIYQNENVKARIIFKSEEFDFGIIKVLPNEILRTPFSYVDLGIEPITGTEDNLKIAGFTEVEELPYIFRPTNLTHTKYPLKDTSNLYLALKDKVIPGMSRGPVWHERSGAVIGIAKAKIEHKLLEDLKYGLAIPMSQIRDNIKEQDEIPEGTKQEILAHFPEIQRLETISFPAFNEYDINFKLFGENPERFRSEGPQLVDFERGDWVYVPKISHEISKMILDGKVVILGGKPATRKSAVSRYIGYEFMKEKQVSVYYIDFPALALEDIKDIINNLKKIINSPNFKTLKKDNHSPLFIFENIHDPQLNQDRFIPSLIALKEKVKILITTRSELSAFDWIEEDSRINLDNLLDINKEIINGIVNKFNLNRKHPIKWEYKDPIGNLWLLGWYLRVVEDSQDQELIISDSKEFNEKLMKLIDLYYEKNFRDFPTNQIITILLIISVTSQYETPIEEDFIINNVISKFQGLDTNNTKQIINILERKREISSKKIENLEDMSVVSFEYRIPHIKLAEILQDIYLNEYNKEKFETIFINYIQKGKNTEILGHNLWIQEKFQLALKSFKLNKVEEDLIKIYLKYCKFKIKVSKGHVHGLDFKPFYLIDIPENLHNFSELKFLNLSNNQISEIQGLENLQKLEKLYLYSNQISEIQGLENLQYLQKLELDNNQIQENEINLITLRAQEIVKYCQEKKQNKRVQEN